jgi:imidazolonepropionase-like amidohydrolase
VPRTLLLASLVAAVFTSTASAQTADTIVVNGTIVTVDAKESVVEALAIREGRIVAAGTSAAMRKLAGAGTRTIDVQGRTVIPGLIDSHLHAIRAALSFSTEVNWIGAKSIEEALGRIRKAAQTKPRGSWLIVAGGWNEQQFAERRRPTQAELEAAAPDNPGSNATPAATSPAPSAARRGRSLRCSIGCRALPTRSRWKGRARSFES